MPSAERTREAASFTAPTAPGAIEDRAHASPSSHGACVLILDGHTNQALSCVRSLGRAGYRAVVASTQRAPLAAWSRYCGAHFRLAGETRADLAALRSWAAARGVAVVLPQRERSCRLVSAEREEWEAAGITVGCGPEDMLLLAFDKARTLEVAERCGVRIPPTYFPTSLEESRAAAAAVGYPCIVKSRFSDYWDGSRFVADAGALYVRDAAALDAAVSSCRQGELWPIIQGIVPGRGKGVFALCDHGEPLAWFAHERLRDVRPSGSGSSLRRSVLLDPRLRDAAARLLRAMRWHGPAMVEFRDEGTGDPWLMEVNGRFWGSLELAVTSGVDFPRLWVELLRGAPVTPPAFYRPGVSVRWLWGDAKRLMYIMAGAPPGCPTAYPTLRQGLREVLGRQPRGTRIETWASDDRWPAFGEWVQGVRELAKTTFKGRAPAAARPTATGDTTPVPVETRRP